MIILLILFLFNIIGKYIYNNNINFINNNNKLFYFLRIISIIMLGFIYLNKSPFILLIIIPFFGIFDGLYKSKMNNEYGNKLNDDILIKITFLGF